MFPGETLLSGGGGAKVHYTELKVICSNQYYIGTMFLSCGVLDCKECGEYNFGGRQRAKGDELDYGSRETDYFKTKEEADAALEEYKKTDELPNQRY